MLCEYAAAKSVAGAMGALSCERWYSRGPASTGVRGIWNSAGAMRGALWKPPLLKALANVAARAVAGMGWFGLWEETERYWLRRSRPDGKVAEEAR